MANLDPRGVIIEHLAQPSAGQPPARRPPPRPGDLPMRPVASFAVSGNPFTADRTTIQFVKERGIPDRRLYAVTFDDEQHESWFWLVAAERDRTDNWIAVDVAGGSGQDPQRSKPWLNLCGSWGQGRLYAGGEIHTAGANVGEVRLTLADGTQLTDDAQADVALFLSDQVAAEPATVDIYDTNGHLLATHTAF
ncbi:MAG: hypothetical protein ACR2ND_00005 [Solirubrobacteraceae bacterium]